MNGDGLTLIVVTHDPAVGRRADRILRMFDGKIIERVAGRDLPEVLGVVSEPQGAD
jgi:ABC-type lipoprotein export system ATPase subunit